MSESSNLNLRKFRACREIGACVCESLERVTRSTLEVTIMLRSQNQRPSLQKRRACHKNRDWAFEIIALVAKKRFT